MFLPRVSILSLIHPTLVLVLISAPTLAAARAPVLALALRGVPTRAFLKSKGTFLQRQGGPFQQRLEGHSQPFFPQAFHRHELSLPPSRAPSVPPPLNSLHESQWSVQPPTSFCSRRSTPIRWLSRMALRTAWALVWAVARAPALALALHGVPIWAFFKS